MRQFLIEAGDLVLDRSHYTMVEGPSRVGQDLRHAVEEPFGSDRFHPKWGSVLDSYVGTSPGPATQQLIRSEMVRIFSNYQQVQRAQVLEDMQRRRRSRFGRDEIVEAAEDVEVRQAFDRFWVTAQVEMSSLDTLPISTEVSG